MNTEITDNNDRETIRGWVGYDDGCGLCVGLVRRFAGPFERRGFVFVPLQNPWMAKRLGLVPGTLPDEMKLLLGDARILGGAEAIVALLSAIWWLAPVGWAVWIPPIRAFTKAAYRWVARNRQRVGICRIPERTGHPHHNHTAFFEAP